MGGCIFCGGWPLSKEHIWAKWLRRHLSFDDVSHRSMTATMRPEGRSEFVKKHGGDIRGRGIRCVCEPCNSGWMSALQEKAKPTVLRMLDGSPFGIDRDAQSDLSAWVSMAVMAAEQMDKSRIAISASDRIWLYQQRSAPPDWGIWIARHEISSTWKPIIIQNALRIAEDGVDLRNSGIRSHNTQSTTYKVGNIFIHAMSCAFADIVRDLRYDIMFPGKVFRIFPWTANIDWPPGPISDWEAMFIATQFYEVGPSEPSRPMNLRARQPTPSNRRPEHGTLTFPKSSI